MAHISFSELKNWNKCPWYHKNLYVDKLAGFQGNEFTAFGTALHNVCEKKLLKESKDPDVEFLESFIEEIKSLKKKEITIDINLIKKMRSQGPQIIPEIDPAIREYFNNFKVISTEEKIFEPISFFESAEYNFKGFIDLVIQTEDGKYHIVDWKTCGWGWDKHRRSDRMTTYQLTLYKHFYALKHNIDPEDIETHFALLKRTAKKDRVEFFRVTSGPRKTENALTLLKKALYNIDKKSYIKNRLACTGCEFYQTEYCI
jgi:ATP-dependent exoDNAse (exonuclease V) beta subunit